METTPKPKRTWPARGQAFCDSETPYCYLAKKELDLELEARIQDFHTLRSDAGWTEYDLSRPRFWHHPRCNHLACSEHRCSCDPAVAAMVSETWWVQIVPGDPDPRRIEFPDAMEDIDVVTELFDLKDGFEHFQQADGSYIVMSADGRKRLINGTEGWVEISAESCSLLADVEPPEFSGGFEARAIRWAKAIGFRYPEGGATPLADYLTKLEDLLAAEAAITGYLNDDE